MVPDDLMLSTLGAADLRISGDRVVIYLDPAMDAELREQLLDELLDHESLRSLLLGLINQDILTLFDQVADLVVHQIPT